MHKDGRELPGRAHDHPHRRPRPADVHRLRPRHHRPAPASSRSSRRAARGSSPPQTRRAAGWSATSTTAPRTACSRSAWSSRCSRPGSATTSAEHLARVREELQHAVDELRELARGIHPAVLTELGLIPALRTLARRAPLPVDLHYETRAPLSRAGRGRRLLPRRRSPDQHRPLRPRHPRRHHRRHDRRHPDDRDHRRRPRRRRPRERLRPARHGRPPQRARRHAHRVERLTARASRG